MSEDAPKTKPAKKPRSRGRRIFLAIFKWTRVVILLALLGVIILGIFLNRVGLPDWVHRRVVAQLQAKGWEIEFSRLRLRWYSGIVADDLQLSRTNTSAGPQLLVETAEFRLNGRALRSFDLQADSVMLAGGRFVWPLPGTNQPKRTFVLNKVSGELFFKPGDQWELRSLQAQSLGANVYIRGNITNASLIRDWKLPKKERKDPPEPEGNFWRDFLTQAGKVRAPTPLEINVVFALDARDPRSLDATAKLIAPAAESPWGAATNLTLVVRALPPARSNDALQVDLKLTADQPRTPWGAGKNLQLSTRLAPSLTGLFPTDGTLKLDVLQPRTPWGDGERFTLDARTEPITTNTAARLTTFTLTAEHPQTEHGHARSVQFTARATHAATNLLPASVQSVTTLEAAQSPWATSAWTRVEASFDLPRRDELLLARTNLAWPDRLQNIPFDLTATFSNALGAHLEFAGATLTNRWHPPLFRLEAEAQSSAGALALNSSLDTDTRAATFNATFRGDPHRLAPFLPTNALPWLADWQSAAPLEVQAAGHATLPAWTNRPPDWRAALLTTLSIASRFDAGEAAYRDIRFSAARALCLYTNALWTLPEIRVTRPEGVVEADAEIDGRTGAFRTKLRSTINPLALRPAFSLRQQRTVFDLFEFTAPPSFDGEVRGSLRDFATLHATGSASVTNVTFRKQFARFATARAEYTNGFLSVYHPLILRDGEQGGADGVGINLARQRLHLTNGYGNLAPMVVARAIGPHIVRAIEPYVFDVSPQVRVNGSVPIDRGGTEDLRFEVEGGAFHWWRIHADTARASIHWLGDDLTITNLQARWCGGNARGWMLFDFGQPKGGAMSFHVTADGAQLHHVVRDLRAKDTNRLEGALNIELTVTQASVNDFKSWQGHGQARLTDGLIWDSPFFGAASTVLNSFAPGLGNSRAKQATNTFFITNSVLHTRDLKIEATGMHLKYRGTVDFDGNVDARMEAQLLRGVPGLGPLLSAVLWPVGKIFEYRVTGTLDNPKLDEAYFIPKVLLFPLQPFKTMKSLFGDDEKKGDKEQKPPPTPLRLPQ